MNKNQCSGNMDLAKYPSMRLCRAWTLHVESTCDTNVKYLVS